MAASCGSHCVSNRVGEVPQAEELPETSRRVARNLEVTRCPLRLSALFQCWCSFAEESRPTLRGSAQLRCPRTMTADRARGHRRLRFVLNVQNNAVLQFA